MCQDLFYLFPFKGFCKRQIPYITRPGFPLIILRAQYIGPILQNGQTAADSSTGRSAQRGEIGRLSIRQMSRVIIVSKYHRMINFGTPVSIKIKKFVIIFLHSQKRDSNQRPLTPGVFTTCKQPGDVLLNETEYSSAPFRTFRQWWHPTRL